MENINYTKNKMIITVPNPKETILNIIKTLKRVPSILENIIKGDTFIEEIKDTSLILAKALEESIKIITPEVEETVFKLVKKVSTSTFLAILDAIGVIPGIGEILDLILVAHNILRAIFAVTNVGLEATEISSSFISNLMRIYKTNLKEVESSEDRIGKSINTFRETTENSDNFENKQTGGKKKFKRNKNKTNKKKSNKYKTIRNNKYIL